MDITLTLHTFHRRPACTPSACQRQEGTGGIKGIRDVKGLILLAKPLSVSSCCSAVQGSLRPADGSRPCSSTTSMTWSRKQVYGKIANENRLTAGYLPKTMYGEALCFQHVPHGGSEQKTACAEMKCGIVYHACCTYFDERQINDLSIATVLPPAPALSPML